MPAKKAAPKKETPAKKVAVKRAPRKKAEPKATVNSIPVLRGIKGKLLNVNPLIKYGAMAVILIGFFAWGKSLIKKRQITKGIKKVEKLEVKTDDKQRHIDSLNAALIRYEEAFDKIYGEAEQATAERIQTEKRGEQIRTETKKKTDETIKRIQNPNNTDADRERLARELLSRPSHNYSDEPLR